MRKTNKLIAAAVTGACAVLTTPAAAGVLGCEASGGKQVAGAIIGGVIGGVAGNNIIKKDQQAGTIVGATAGAAAGSYVGCEMQKKDGAPTPAPRVREVYVAPPPPPPPRVVYENPPPRVVYESAPPRTVYVREHDDDDHRYHERRRHHRHGMPPGHAKKYWSRGERMPVVYVTDRQYVIYEPARYRLRPAPRGYRWVRYDSDAYLVAMETGLIAEVVRAMLD